MTSCRLPSFWAETRMLCGKLGKWDSGTEWRIYYADDDLPLSSPQQRILHIHFRMTLIVSIILSGVKNGTYKDKTCYVLSLKTAHSKKCFRPSPCGGRRKRFSDEIISLPLKKRMPLFQTYASEVSCYITLRETSSPERFAQAPAFISFTMPFIRLYSPSMRRRSSIFLVRRSLE